MVKEKKIRKVFEEIYQEQLAKRRRVRGVLRKDRTKDLLRSIL